MKYLITVLFLLLVSACYVQASAPPQDDAGTDGMALKTCHVPGGGMYNVTFKKLSGDCPDVTEGGNAWINPDGTRVDPPECKDYSVVDPCTTYVNEDCKSWVYDQWLTGQLNWSPSGDQATGNLTFTAYVLQNGALFCSSVYETTFTLQWQAAQ